MDTAGKNLGPQGFYTPPDQLMAMYQADLAAMNRPLSLEEFGDEMARLRRQKLTPGEMAVNLRLTARRLAPEDRFRLPRAIGDEHMAAQTFWQLSKNYPKTQDLLSSPEFLAVFGDRFKSIGFLGRLWGSTGGALGGGLGRGWKNIDFLRGVYQEAAAKGHLGDPAFLARYARWQASQEAAGLYEENLEASSGWAMNLAREFLTNMGDMTGGMLKAGATPETLIGALTGALAGAVAGPAGAGAGARQGALWGMSTAMGEAAGGSVFFDAWENLPEDLKNERLELALPTATGLASMALERLGLGVLFRGSASMVGKGLSRAGRKIAPKQMARLGQTMTSGAAGRLTRLGVGAAAHTLPEVGIEALQEGLETAMGMPYAEELARRFPGRGIAGPSWEDVGQAMRQAAWKTFWGGAGIGLLPPTVEFLTDPQGLKRLSPEQRAALAEHTLKAAGTKLALEGTKKGNEQLKAGVKAATEEMRKHPEFAQNPEAAEALLTGISGGEKTVFVPARTVENFMQEALERPGVDWDSLQTEFLEPLGVSSEVFLEALDNDTDLQVDLNALPQVLNHPLWDKVADELTVEPSSLTREMEAELEALGPPPIVLDRAGADVSPETRSELEQGLTAAGRTAPQARREAELLSRLASTLARVTGTDPNQMLRERVAFARAGEEGARSLHQPELAGGKRRKYDGLVPLEVSSEEAKTLRGPDEGFTKRLIQWAQDKGVFGKYTNLDSGMDNIEFNAASVRNVKQHYGWSGKLALLEFAPDLIENGIYLESSTRNDKGLKSHIFAGKAKIDGMERAVGFVVREDINGRRYFDHRIVDIYEKYAGEGAAAPSPYRPARETPDNRVTGNQSITNIVKKHLGVNPGLTFEQTGPRGWLDILSDGSFVVRFSQAADASTAVHEFAHLFREMIRQTLETKPEQIADQEAFQRLQEGWRDVEGWLAHFDDDAVLKAEYDRWLRQQNFGGRDFEVLSPEEKARARDMAKHEHFARGFETYLMEGKAPTSGLRRFFSQMKKALIKLYEAVTGLGVELSDDVRRFFDSILTTEEELAMESWRGQTVFSAEELALFQEIAPQVLAEYEAAADLARQRAAEEITAARVAERERLRRLWRRDGKVAAREDLSQEHLNEIVRQGGISFASLKTSYDADTIRALVRKRPGLVSKKKDLMGFDEWAGHLGFESGDDLIHALLDTPTLKQLEDRYAAEREAEFDHYEGEAPISDAEIELWERERNLWARFMLPKGSKYAPRSARDLKRIIEEKTGLLTVDEIKRQNALDLKASLKAQARAAREGHKAGQTAGLMAGVREGTQAGRREGRAWARLEALEKRLELGLKYREQINRQREIFQFETQARRVLSRKTGRPDQAGGLIPDYQDQIKNLLAAAGFGGRGVPAASTLAEFVAGLEADGAPVEVAQWLRDGRAWLNPETGRRRTYRSLTLPELRDLRRAVSNLEHLSGRQKKVNVEGRLMDEADASLRLIGAIREHHKIREPKSHIQKLEEAGRKGAVSSVLEAASGYMSSIIKVETMARTLDGHEINGTVQQMIYQPLNRAWEQAMGYSQMFTGRLKEIVEQTVGAKAMNAWRGEKVSVEGLPVMLTREQLIVAALNTGNPQNLRALMNIELGENGETMTEAQLQAIKDSLTKEQWDFVQAVWDFLDNEMYPLLNELTLRTKGVELAKVEGAPVKTKYGEYRGGYFPLRFDRSMSERADRFHDMADTMLANQSLYARPDTQAPTTIEREGKTYKNLVPRLNIGVLINSLNESIQDLTHREAVNDVWRLIRRPEVRGAIEGVLGDNYWNQIKRWLRETAKPEMVGDPGAASLVRKLRRNTSLAAMGLKMSVAACQATGITQSVHKLGWWWTFMGIKEYYGNPAKMLAVRDEIYSKSVALANRNKTSYDRDIHEALTLRNPLTGNVRDKLTDIYFKPIALLDQAVANPVWLGGYLKALKEGKREAEAVSLADSILRITQPTGATKDQSRAQRGWGFGEWGRVFNMFSTFFSGTQNLIWEQYHQTAGAFRRGEYLTGTWQAGRAGLMLVVFPALLEFLVKNFGLPEDEEDMVTIGQGVLSYFMGGLPVVKDLVGFYTGASFRFEPAPVQSTLTNISGLIRGPQDFLTDEEIRGAGRLARGLAAAGVPIPAGQIAASLKGWEDWDENDGFEKFYRLFIREPY